MNNPSKEDLLGYMLGALDADEHVKVQQAIDRDPRLEDNLLALKSLLTPLEVIDRPSGPPPGLARRTCQVISSATRLDQREFLLGPTLGELDVGESSGKNLRAALACGMEQPAERSRFHPAFSFSDFLVGLVAAGVLGALLLPAIMAARTSQRVNACQSNLHGIYQALASYADDHGGYFVPIPKDGYLAVAGAFAPILRDGGYLSNVSVFSCPDRSPSTMPKIPTCDELRHPACARELTLHQQSISGDYGYSLGQKVDRNYLAPRRRFAGSTVLVADAPQDRLGLRNVANHSGRGSNCLLEDGQVVLAPRAVLGNDAIYENDLGQVAAGIHPNDSVIAHGSFPLVHAVIQN